MQKLKLLNSTAVPLPIEDVDTDQIIPARFLKGISKDGFGENLFRDWRYDKQDNKISDFVLNNKIYTGEILVSSFFADIFKGNALNNGILPITVSNDELNLIFKKIEDNPKVKFSVDLPNQVFYDGTDLNISFELDAYKKECLLNGYDDIDYLLNLKEEIVTYEQRHLAI